MDKRVRDSGSWRWRNEKVGRVLKGKISGVGSGSSRIKATESGKTVEMGVDVDRGRYLDIGGVEDKVS
ncbi:hypothetical protein, partial [Paenibacillus xylanexedens]|uniref:hypothetical protein n=1 Tax=Paenibacillus xylanexedens TaxID=528191 RepID=UPI003F79A9E1